MDKITRKEYVLKADDIIYSVEFLGILFFAAFMLARICQNYFLASIFCFVLIKYFGNSDVHFYKNKLSKLVLRKYAYTAKLTISLLLIITMIMSVVSFKAFICSIVLSIIWKEYMKAFNKRKSLI